MACYLVKVIKAKHVCLLFERSVRHIILMTIPETSILVPFHILTSLCLIWRSGYQFIHWYPPFSRPNSQSHYAPVPYPKMCHFVKKYAHHDDVIEWKHFPRYWPFVRGIHRSPVNSPHEGQWCGALMFSLICVWINSWVNNREAGDLRRYHAHYDITVMCVAYCCCKMVHSEIFCLMHCGISGMGLLRYNELTLLQGASWVVQVMWRVFTFYPSSLRAGGVLSSRSGRLGGRLPNLRNPYLGNCLTDFLNSLSWSFAHLPHMGLPMGQKLVKFGSNWVQTLRNADLWNGWMDLPHLKFHGLV